MSKVEIVGPKDLLQETLVLLRGLGIFQIKPAIISFPEQTSEAGIRSYYPDKKTALEKIFLEEFLIKIGELISLLPQTGSRTSYLDPRPVIDVIARMADRHLTRIKTLKERLDSLQKEKGEMGHYRVFLSALAGLIRNSSDTPDLDYIGLTIQNPEAVERLRKAISRITDWKFGFVTNAAEDGTLVGLITVEKAVSEQVKKSLSEEQLPELSFPAAFGELSFPAKLAWVQNRLRELNTDIDMIESETGRLSMQWTPFYLRVREWVQDRLSVITATALAFETRMCFFIKGWMPSRDTGSLRQNLDGAFGNRVVLEEKEVKDEDLDSVPIMLMNPPYFKPFELFTRILPLPAYTSYDPTPFIGIFFPLFFGLILGDAGYGLVLGITAAVLLRRYNGKKGVTDIAHIMAASSLYTIFFGILFGEFFGDLPERLLGLQPLCIERRTAIVPMLCFAAAVGVAHVFLGLLLGAISSVKRHEKKEALYRLLSMLVILCTLTIVGSLAGLFPSELTRPGMLAILFLAPLLFFAGGLLAPLELLKSIGNIISYVRIMAIGLTSVLLAFVANQLGGLTGDLYTGVLVAGMLHLLNLILGVFSPTIHTLRLHYVEFFSKFIEHGGKRFEPYKK
ncbi:MAG: ATPase [Thermodesulfovibrio sp.]|nr:ATPase [Thermodesulfovibrio sp.]